MMNDKLTMYEYGKLLIIRIIRRMCLEYTNYTRSRIRVEMRGSKHDPGTALCSQNLYVSEALEVDTVYRIYRQSIHPFQRTLAPIRSFVGFVVLFNLIDHRCQAFFVFK